MRSAKAVGEDFPYLKSTMCYIEIPKQGDVVNIPHKNKSDIPNLMAAVQRVRNGESKLYVVWPGKWSADMFEVDDLDTLMKALMSARYRVDVK